jgi:hypothetical protein
VKVVCTVLRGGSGIYLKLAPLPDCRKPHSEEPQSSPLTLFQPPTALSRPSPKPRLRPKRPRGDCPTQTPRHRAATHKINRETQSQSNLVSQSAQTIDAKSAVVYQIENAHKMDCKEVPRFEVKGRKGRTAIRKIKWGKQLEAKLTPQCTRPRITC